MKKLILLLILLLFFVRPVFADLYTVRDQEGKIVAITNQNIFKAEYQELGYTFELWLKQTKKTPTLDSLIKNWENKEGLIIKEYSGSGAQTTRPFIAETAWEIQWDTKAEDFMIFQIYLYDGNGNLAGVAANQTKPGKGSFYSPKKGTFYLNINAICDWEIKIIAVE
jgi:hypothetical protein